MSKVKTIVFVAYPGMVALDLAGPLEVFATANHLAAAGTPYALVVASPEGGIIASNSGLAVSSVKIGDLDQRRLDTIIVPGGGSPRAPACPPELVSWLKDIMPSVRRTCSICTGAFILAKAGLLDGKRATTHWAMLDVFVTRHPNVRIERKAIFVEDAGVWTSAGVSTGIDLALALIEQDLGHHAAMQVARILAVHMKRPANQSQISTALQAQERADGDFSKLLAWVADNVTEDLRLEVLADHCGMSVRSFTRRFSEQVGKSPARAVAEIRIELARSLIAAGTQPLKEIAHLSGLGSEQSLRRALRAAPESEEGGKMVGRDTPLEVPAVF